VSYDSCCCESFDYGVRGPAWLRASWCGAIGLCHHRWTDGNWISPHRRRSAWRCPDTILNSIRNAAVYIQVDRAESEREEAYAVNADGPQYLVEVANTIGARVIHISTDYVFNGHSSRPYRPDGPTEPLNVYGASKLEGEKRVRSLCPERTLILRSGWLYDAHGKNFVMTMLKLMHEWEEIRVVTDEVGTPTWAKTLARAVWLAAEQKALHGIYHWTDEGVASRYEFATAIQEEALALGLLARPIRIRPIRTAEYPTAAQRPAYAVLDKAATIADFGLTPIHWRIALRQMLAELAHA
jgi:dTDP-4-dehydrorhamnose reductase